MKTKRTERKTCLAQAYTQTHGRKYIGARPQTVEEKDQRALHRSIQDTQQSQKYTLVHTERVNTHNSENAQNTIHN